ncbi:MAG TPA: DUF2383 domain-containing protein [Planktothrix sp.]|jgi:hypothetical protein
MANQADNLNNLLKGELSAVQTYCMALDKAKTPNVVEVLSENKCCHEKRVEKLSQLVLNAGGEPVTESGAWGAFAKTVEAGSAVLGESPAIGSLQEGEDHGIELYKAEMKHLEPGTLAIVEQELFPAQQRTQEAISNLKPDKGN